MLLQSASQNAGSALFSINPQLPVGLVTTQFLSVIETMGSAAQDILPDANRIANLEIIKRASQWALARTFQFLFQWHTTVCPGLIGPMVKLHLRGGRVDHPALAALISHVLDYIKVYQSKRSYSRTAGECGNS